jgi:cob(I)alamin adenosyltransferase
MGKIYTRSGDEGNTHLFGGQRVSKSVPRVVAYGAVDELNSHVGVIRSVCDDDQITDILKNIQSLLFVCGADLASPQPDDDQPDPSSREKRIQQKDVDQLEAWIDELTEELEPLSNFVLPGETTLAAQLHKARSICRRAERASVTLNEEDPLKSETILPFLNRLSDLFFTLARVCNKREGVDEIPWNAPLPEHDDQAETEKDISFDED